MPKISDAHREARRRQVIEAAMRCVARKGFAGLTMADVIEESGMSAGAVYTYFPGKSAIIAEMTQVQLARVLDLFDRAVAAPELPDLVGLLRFLTENILAAGAELEIDLPVVLFQVMAEGMVERDDTEALVRSRIGPIRARWRAVVVRLIDAGRLPGDTDPDAVAAILMSLLPGYLLQARVLGPIAPETYAEGLAALLRSDFTPEG